MHKIDVASSHHRIAIVVPAYQRDMTMIVICFAQTSPACADWELRVVVANLSKSALFAFPHSILKANGPRMTPRPSRMAPRMTVTGFLACAEINS